MCHRYCLLFGKDEHRIKQPSEWRLHITLDLFVFVGHFCLREFKWILKKNKALWCEWIMRLLCFERDTVVRCVQESSVTSCWGHALHLAQRCIQRQFFFSDTDHIEPFVSRQFNVFTQFNFHHFLLLQVGVPKQSWGLQVLNKLAAKLPNLWQPCLAVEVMIENLIQMYKSYSHSHTKHNLKSRVMGYWSFSLIQNCFILPIVS